MSEPSQGGEAFGLRSLVASLYAPGAIYAVGQGAIIPVIALMARHVGASVPIAGAMVGLRGFGTMLGDVPAGALVARIGDRRAVLAATVVQVASSVAAAMATTTVVLAIAVAVSGFGWAIWGVARLSYATGVLPAGRRGQGIATLGGASRVGTFAGPFVGAGVISVLGLSGAFWVAALASACGCALMLSATRLPNAVTATPDHGAATPDHGAANLRATARAHSRALLGPGAGALLIGALRASRQALLPLWAAHVGIDATGVSVIFGVSSGLDMLLFAPAGWASDRWGRKKIAVVCLVILAAGQLAVPATHSFDALLAVGLLLGFGNGVGSGIVMTMGADLAPRHRRAAFLGLWRFIADTGGALGPFMLSGLIALSAIGPAAVAVGAVGLTAAAVMGLRMPDLATLRPAD